LYSLPFLFTVTPTPIIYTLSLHDALPISHVGAALHRSQGGGEHGWGHPDCPSGAGLHGRRAHAPRHAPGDADGGGTGERARVERSEEHTSELQSLRHLVCRLLLEKKKYGR